MSFLNAAINNVEDELVREELQDRVDLVRHKIKFMDKVPVAVLDAHNAPNPALNELLNLAGGQLEIDPKLARVVLYLEPGSSMLNLMGVVPAMLEKEWPAVEYNRLYLLDEIQPTEHPAEQIALLEDLAEILNPGYFVFGNEGKTWISFGV
ncbi:iron complex transport system substrate-binding protein [Pedobacter sp. CAN_A7]|uniref:hypothetical protein n=1 Tax=Pedobacter sp. CAN_A7 TaxID=2787722 RepID=UPI0018CB3E6C